MGDGHVRILVVVPQVATREEILLRSAQVTDGWLDPSTELVWRPVRFAAPQSDSFYSDLVTELAVLEAGLGAEQEGFDAVTVDTVSDKALFALRSRLSIPVVAPGIAGFHLASVLGDRISVIVTWEKWIHFYRRNLALYGLQHKLASIRCTGDAPSSAPFSPEHRARTINKIVDAAREAARDDGADVVMLGSTTMHWSAGPLREAVRIPVVNPGPWALKLAESLAKAGLAHSKTSYMSPETTVDALIHAAAEDAASATSRRQER